MKNKWTRLLILALLFSWISNLFQLQYAIYIQNQTLEEAAGATVGTDTSETEDNSTSEIEEIQPVKYKLSLKQIEDNKEVWETYTVDVIEEREDYGIYWLTNSKTEGYFIKLKFNEDGTVDISEHNELRVKVRHLAKLNGGSIIINTYDKLEIPVQEDTPSDETPVETSQEQKGETKND